MIFIIYTFHFLSFSAHFYTFPPQYSSLLKLQPCVYSVQSPTSFVSVFAPTWPNFAMAMASMASFFEPAKPVPRLPGPTKPLRFYVH